MVRLNNGRCPAHGSVHPEGYCYPLTVTAEALRFMARAGSHCIERGCEEPILLDCEIAYAPLHQHLVLWYGDTPEELLSLGFIFENEYEEIRAGRMLQPPRIVCELSQVESGVWAQGEPLARRYREMADAS